MSNQFVQRAFMSAVFCFLLFSVCSPISAQNSGQDRPIQGMADGSVVGQIPPNGLEISYVGRASHLGKHRRDEVLFLNPDGSVTGQIVFYSANGDQLNANVTGQFVSPTTAQGHYSFAGGTGRFTGATGQAQFEAVTPDGLNVRVRFSGTINY